mmetsp:Transcript_31609/g.74640  ORF Transcript_31609/g.74640 Transcript_31609/m.74640 type:complete len:211 (-) Transcript_31609:42-674(-)
MSAEDLAHRRQPQPQLLQVRHVRPLHLGRPGRLRPRPCRPRRPRKSRWPGRLGRRDGPGHADHTGARRAQEPGKLAPHCGRQVHGQVLPVQPDRALEPRLPRAWRQRLPGPPRRPVPRTAILSCEPSRGGSKAGQAWGRHAGDKAACGGVTLTPAASWRSSTSWWYRVLQGSGSSCHVWVRLCGDWGVTGSCHVRMCVCFACVDAGWGDE